MNKVEKLENGSYVLTTEDGRKFPCERWFEKKVGKYHVKLDKNGQELTGRTYIRESHFDNSNVYEFENKTEHRVGITSGGWKNQMTEEESEIVKNCELTIEKIKNECLSRKPEKVDLNSEEGILKEIERLKKKYQEIKN